MGNYTAVWKKYATFSGRATRAEFWTFAIINVVIYGVLTGIGVANTDLAIIGFGLVSVIALAALIPSLAVLWRRLHDTGRSGGWFFITFVPVIGAIWLFILTLTGGTTGPNPYGPDPRSA